MIRRQVGRILRDGDGESVHGGDERGEVGFGVTCMAGRGRGRVPAHDRRSSSRARLSISNCLSCSRTEASREAVLAHCSIHTLRAEQRTGQAGHERTGQGHHQKARREISPTEEFNHRTDKQRPKHRGIKTDGSHNR